MHEVFMKSATFPALRVDPELRRSVEAELHDNETLSSFMEAALRAGIERRRMQREFIARGLASRELARQTGDYVDAEDVHAELERMLKASMSTAQSR
ncbi:YlcI/YnfO family protein [Burkholderia gladioli]|uniref:YlcI/YnfO family protein n=1 Tax=Burkholderia gladioli TaxID=28095 RepID=UPI003F68B127